MARKQLSNLGYLMKLLNISAKELSQAINIDQSSVSRWRTGLRNPPVDMPYFNLIVNYLADKNSALSNGLLEDFFNNYTSSKIASQDELRRLIRNYILNIHDKRIAESADDSSYNAIYGAKETGAEGRYMMINSLLDAALKLSSPSEILILETELFVWMPFNKYSEFVLKLKKLINQGHKVKIIFQEKISVFLGWGGFKVFLDIMFHENLTLFSYTPRITNETASSIYILSGRITVMGYCFESDFANMFSCLFHDTQYAMTMELVWQRYMKMSTSHLITNKQADLEKIFFDLKSAKNSGESYLFAGKTLSIATMSEELLYEILEGNNLTKEQKRLCIEFYYTLKDNIESSAYNPMNGFYYNLDNIMGPLSQEIIPSYGLSATSGRIVTMTNAQYLRHFRETALILKNDKRYRVQLTSSASPMAQPSSYLKAIWFKDDCWLIMINSDEYSGKIKLMYVNDYKTMNIVHSEFMYFYERISNKKRDNAYVADLFMKIANGEKL